MFRNAAPRLLIAVAAVAMASPLATGPAASADATTFAQDGLTVTVSGLPVALLGDHGSCNDNMDDSAHLSHDLTITVSDIPQSEDGDGPTRLFLNVGNRSWSADLNPAQPGDYVVPATGGGGGHFSCYDAEDGGLFFGATALNDRVTLTAFGEYIPLSNVD